MKMTLDRPLRPEHLNTGMPYSYDLNALGTELLNEPAIEQSGKTAATLIDHPQMKLILTVIKAGVSLAEHSAKAPVTITCIKGKVTFITGDESIGLKSGQAITFPPNVRHSATAQSDCTFLIVMGGEGEDG